MAAAPRPLGATLSASAYPLAVASAVFIIAVGLPSTDSDTYWQLAMGRWMLDHHAFLRQDIFSSTVAGAHFGVGEWLGQIAFAGSFGAAGWAGVAVLRATLLAVAAFFVVRLARRGSTPWTSLGPHFDRLRRGHLPEPSAARARRRGARGLSQPAPLSDRVPSSRRCDAGGRALRGVLAARDRKRTPPRRIASRGDALG